jgi:hypothetical protein
MVEIKGPGPTGLSFENYIIAIPGFIIALILG